MDLEQHLIVTRKKLEEIKPNLALLALDFDGTVSDETHKQDDVFGLVAKILAANKSVAFITARAATAIKLLIPPLRELLNRHNYDIPCFVAGGNGTVLYHVTKNDAVVVYNHGFSLSEVKQVVETGKEVYISLGVAREALLEKGLTTFQNFLADTWEGYIPEEYLAVCRTGNGEFFSEQAKVTFVLPKDISLHQQVVSEFAKRLPVDFQAVLGDTTYVHVTKKLKDDSKKTAVKTVMEKLSLKENQVATFGDMPHGNDAGLLSLVYGFTNAEAFAGSKKEAIAPPYILPDLDVSPVDRVYRAIEILVS